MLDPKAKFTVYSVTREEIAEELNDFYNGYDEGENVLAPDDDRLTDEVCQAFANKLAEIDASELTQSQHDEADAELFHDTLVSLGFDMTARDAELDQRWAGES